MSSGFQRHGFRIPQAKVSWIPDSRLLSKGGFVGLGTGDYLSPGKVGGGGGGEGGGVGAKQGEK